MLQRFGRNKPLLLFTIACAIVALIGVSTFLISFNAGLDVWEPFKLFADATETALPESGAGTQDIAAATRLLVGFGFFCIFLLIIYSIRYPQRTIINIILLVLIFFLFQGVSLSADTMPASSQAEAEAEVESFIPQSDLEPLVDFSAQPPSRYTYYAATILAFFAAVIAWRWPRKYDLSFEPSPITTLQQDAANAIEEIKSGGSLREVILDCYTKMVRSVQENRGIGLSSEMTAREFEARLLNRGLPPSAIQRLTRLFESARYSNGDMGERDRREAISCLSEVVEAIEQPVAAEGAL